MYIRPPCASSPATPLVLLLLVLVLVLLLLLLLLLLADLPGALTPIWNLPADDKARVARARVGLEGEGNGRMSFCKARSQG